MAADLVELHMNVSALKRFDPYVKEILGTATQVALYTFCATKNEWNKTDIEGALFVYSRNGEPYNSILIMNRLNTNNLVEPIVKDLDWQMQAPFLLYRNSKNNIFGIWFYNRDECVKITYMLENIVESLNSNSRQEKQNKNKEMSGGADIFSMLSKAQEDFNKTPIKTEQQPHQSTPKAPDGTSQSVMDFFAKASTTKAKNQPPVCIPSGDILPAEPLQPLLHRLMSNPAHSVEHIEKQQRATTPQDQSVLRRSKRDPPFNNNKEIFKGKSISPNQTRPVKSLDCPQNLLENGINTINISSPTTSTSPRPYYMQQLINPSFPDRVEEDSEVKSVSPPLVSFLETPQKPALMPPMMFTSSANKDSRPAEGNVPTYEPLTKKQMIQAFQYLLRNDPEFMTKLHEAYVKSFTEIIS